MDLPRHHQPHHAFSLNISFFPFYGNIKGKYIRAGRRYTQRLIPYAANVSVEKVNHYITLAFHSKKKKEKQVDVTKKCDLSKKKTKYGL